MEMDKFDNILNILIKLVHTKYRKIFRRDKMEANQKINCTVESCKYNNPEKAKCTLEAIHVAPMKNIDTKNADESMCASYENEQK